MPRNNEPGMGKAKGATSGNGGIRSKYRRSGADSEVRWDSVSPAILLAAVDAITAAGDAVVLSRSGDGGVLSITVCSGPERVKFYSKDGSETDAILADLLTSAGGDPNSL